MESQNVSEDLITSTSTPVNESEAGKQQKPPPSSKKRRRRPRTKELRTQLKTVLDTAILTAENNQLNELFSPLEDGTLAAPLPAFLFQLCTEPLANFSSSKFAQLSRQALKSVSNISRIFRISERPLSLPLSGENVGGQEHKEAGLEVAKAADDLWLLLKPNRCLQREARTVYVDNLPARCTRAKLERRCTQFGAVVNIKFPQIARIQRRISQSIGGTWPAHSGFAFVQFVSKTAAKRFCKRYAANSRLKRVHHHPRHHTKRSRIIQQQTLQMPLEKESREELVNTSTTSSCDLFSADRDQQQGIVIIPQPNAGDDDETRGQFISDICISSCTKQTQFVAPLAPNPSTQIQLCSVGTSEGGLSLCNTRVRCYSVAESTMSVEESGRETDQEEKAPDEANAEQQSVKKKRKRNRRKARPYNPAQRLALGQSLNNLFRQIQAFPFQQYKELRENYLKLKRTRMITLKKQLRGPVEKKAEKEEANVNTRKGNAVEEMKLEVEGKGRKRRRQRGVRRLMSRAEIIKIESLQSDPV